MTIIIIVINIQTLSCFARTLLVFICICHAVSDKRIRQEAAKADRVLTLRDLKDTLSVGTCCGKCMPAARTLLDGINGAAPRAARSPGLVVGLPATPLAA